MARQKSRMGLQPVAAESKLKPLAEHGDFVQLVLNNLGQNRETPSSSRPSHN